MDWLGSDINDWGVYVCVCVRERKGCDRSLGVVGGGLGAYVTIASMVFINNNLHSFLLNEMRTQLV